MDNEVRNDIPIGDLQLYDNYVPQLQAGNWFIQVTQTLSDGNGTINQEPLEAQQEFVVSGPQFSIDPNQIINQYPPAGSNGCYGNVLPHVVLNDPMLPWERKMSDPENRQPWLALMVFEESELVGGDGNAAHTISTTVGAFLKLGEGGITLPPKPVKEDDVDESSPCTYIQMPVKVFAANAPHLKELRYLCHCRQVNTGDKAIQGLNEHGLFSVVISNRFPAAPPKGNTQPVKNIAHLVSLEGMEQYLVENADFGNYQNVALVSLASWVFYSIAESSEDFRALALNLAAAETNASSGKTILDPAKLWLRLPLPNQGSGEDATEAEVTKRLSDGFIPLPYHARTGEDGFAWYRGPLTPVLPALLTKPSPFFTADAAVMYHKTFGVFDFSLAAAWEAGRQAALSDRSFGKCLLEWRQDSHRFIDELHNRLVSDHFSETQIAQLGNVATVQEQFLSILNNQLLKDMGTGGVLQSVEPQQTVTVSSDPVEDTKNFMADPKVQELLQTMVQYKLEPVAEWLGKLLLLYPVPFNYLVPDERMLPVESLRFFYFDNNWLDALLDGALSIGLESSRQTFFSQVTKGIIHDGAMGALAAYRGKLLGVATESAPPAVMSGLLLRSALVSGWPNLAVRPYDETGKLLPILRMDHLSPSVLLCIFNGVPANIELSEPQEGFGFGVDDDGYAVLRNIVPPSETASAPIGKQLEKDFGVRDQRGANNEYLRTVEGRVLNIAPDSANGLVQGIAAALVAAGSPPSSSLGPAAFALQLVKAPEAIRFNSQTAE